jgi:hypothetical protein
MEQGGPQKEPIKRFDYNLAIEETEGALLVRVECPVCRQMVQARGIPVRIPYTNDKLRRRVARGLMFVRPDPSHKAVCEGIQED